MDVLEYEQVKSLGEQQREDMVNLGKSLLSVACRMQVTRQTENQ